MKLNKSKLGVFFSGLFLMTTAVSSYATDVYDSAASVTGSVSPSIELIQTSDYASISFDITDPEISSAKDLVIAADDDANVSTDDVYVAMFQFAMCISSNDPGTTGTDDGSAGVGITFRPSTEMDGDVYKFQETHNSQIQMTLYGATHKNHIRTLAVMLPAGGTYDGTLFGSGIANDAGQHSGLEFIFGGAGALDTGYTVSLNNAGSSTLVTPEVAYQNVPLNTSANVNIYGRNPSLDTSDVTKIGNTATEKGLTATTEMQTLSGCNLNQDPTNDEAALTEALTYVTVYAHAKELAAAMVDTYTLEFSMDIEDSSHGGVNISDVA